MVWVTGYLLIGVLFMTWYWFRVDRDLRNEEAGTITADRQAKLNQARSNIESIPGGMTTVLVVGVLIWPFVVVHIVKARRSK